VAALRKKGWKEAKIRRWLADQERVRARDERVERDGVTQGKLDLEAWREFLEEATRQGRTRVGLLLHWFGGPKESERIQITRRETLPVEMLTVEVLRALEEDVLYCFDSRTRRSPAS
jgi:hypothetical protein